MKVIFLDIDGVVNCKDTMQRHRGFIGIDPYMAFLVGKLVMDTDAKVVLSSSWRNFHDDGIKEIESQVCKLFDVTPNMPRAGGAEACERGYEIKAWLDAHLDVERYAILDDDNDMLPEQQPNFFKTSWAFGINPEICEAVRKHLAD